MNTASDNIQMENSSERSGTYLELIDELGLSWETKDKLIAAGIRSVAALVDKTEDEMAEITGQEVLYEIKDKLKAVGLRLDINRNEYVAEDSECPASSDHIHSWEKIWAVSNTVCMEFECSRCGQRMLLIL